MPIDLWCLVMHSSKDFFFVGTILTRRLNAENGKKKEVNKISQQKDPTRHVSRDPIQDRAFSSKDVTNSISMDPFSSGDAKIHAHDVRGIDSSEGFH